jgi:hypothetical protein
MQWKRSSPRGVAAVHHPALEWRLTAMLAPQLAPQAHQVQSRVTPDKGDQLLPAEAADPARTRQLHGLIIGQIGDGEGERRIHLARNS